MLPSVPVVNGVFEYVQPVQLTPPESRFQTMAKPRIGP